MKVQKTSKKVEVTNVETKEVTIYPSIGAAAKILYGYLLLCKLEVELNIGII